MLNHLSFYFFCFFWLFFFLRLGLGQRRAVVIIGRWLLPSLVDTGDICCHYWQHILVSSTFLQWGFAKDKHHLLNSLRPSEAYMRRWTKQSLAQIMACCLFSVKPLSEPMLKNCQLDPMEQNSGKVLPQFKHFHSWCLKMSPAKWRPFFLSLNELKHYVNLFVTSMVHSDI